MEQNLDNVQPPVKTGKSRDPMKMWVILLVVLLLAVAGLAAWQFMQTSLLSSKVSELETNSSQLQANNNSLQSELNELKGVQTASEDGGQASPESTKILAAVDAYVRAPVAATGAFEYEVKTNDGKFAVVTVGVPEGSGYQLWLKKVGDNWTVLFGGQDKPSQEMIDKYGLTNEVQ